MLLPRDLEKVLRMTVLLLLSPRAFGCRGSGDRPLYFDCTENRSNGVGLNDETLRTVGQKEVDVLGARSRSANYKWEGGRSHDGAGEMTGIARICRKRSAQWARGQCRAILARALEISLAAEGSRRRRANRELTGQATVVITATAQVRLIRQQNRIASREGCRGRIGLRNQHSDRVAVRCGWIVRL